MSLSMSWICPACRTTNHHHSRELAAPDILQCRKCADQTLLEVRP